jgi:hypothetical protein
MAVMDLIDRARRACRSAVVARSRAADVAEAVGRQARHAQSASEASRQVIRRLLDRRARDTTLHG